MSVEEGISEVKAVKVFKRSALEVLDCYLRFRAARFLQAAVTPPPPQKKKHSIWCPYLSTESRALLTELVCKLMETLSLLAADRKHSWPFLHPEPKNLISGFSLI